MGVVYAARDTRLHDRPCAVKVLATPLDDLDARQRFAREIAIAAGLRSPYIVPVWDHGALPDGRPFVVMPLLEGESVGQVLEARCPLDPDRATRLLDGVLLGLAEAHACGVLHRDIKPDNIYLTRTILGQEHAVILDFGVARHENGDDAITASDMLVGTPTYMAPELFQGARPTERSDLYALGMVAYQVLAGRPPFSKRAPVPDEVAVLPPQQRLSWMKLHQPPAPIGTVSAALAEVVRRLLDPSPAQRFARAIDVLLALRGTPEGARALAPLASLVENAAPTVRMDPAALDDFTVPSVPDLPLPVEVGGPPPAAVPTPSAPPPTPPWPTPDRPLNLPDGGPATWLPWLVGGLVLLGTGALVGMLLR